MVGIPVKKGKGKLVTANKNLNQIDSATTIYQNALQPLDPMHTGQWPSVIPDYQTKNGQFLLLKRHANQYE